MQNFFVAAADTVRPLLFSFQNPFTALLRNYGGSKPVNTAAETARDLERMAREIERQQPNLAAELRSFASRA